MSAQQTPGPWEFCNDRDGFWVEARGVQIATISHEKDNAGLGDGEAEANARRIVQCVNAHDELVAALQKVTDFTAERRRLLGCLSQEMEDVDARVVAAIAKATGSAA